MKKGFITLLFLPWVCWLSGCTGFVLPISHDGSAIREEEKSNNPKVSTSNSEKEPAKTEITQSTDLPPYLEDVEKKELLEEKPLVDEGSPELAGPTIEEIIQLEENSLAVSGLDGVPSEKETPEPHPVRFSLPVVENAHVKKFVNHFCGKEKSFFEKALARSGKYVPMMREIFREANIPEDFVYLALIESGYSPYAYSRARAVGPWQFMRYTGRRYGLKIDHWIDERRDPVKATRAAAAYLKDLHEQFGKWFLAAAAYNAGEAKVGRAIRRYRSDDIWHLSKKPYLRRETRNFVPKFLAATLLVRDPEKCGFENVAYEPPWEYDEVTLKEAISLKTAAEIAQTTVETIKELNPALRKGMTPPNKEGFVLRVPAGKGEIFRQGYEQLPKSKKINRIIIYKIRPGDTLSEIASRFGQSVRQIMKTNNLRTSRIRAGRRLMIVY